MSRTIRWSVLMTLFGLAVAVTTYARTGSLGWAIAGLFAAGIVGNMFASGRSGRPR